MRLRNKVFKPYLIYKVMAGFCRLFLLKRVYTLYIGMFLAVIVSMAQSSKKDSILKMEFDIFMTELNEARTDTGNYSLPEALGDCYNYRQLWIKESDGPSCKIERTDSLKNLCVTADYFYKVNLETSNAESSYGLWYYTFEIVGNKYLIIDGSQGVARSVHKRCYYIRKME